MTQIEHVGQQADLSEFSKKTRAAKEFFGLINISFSM